MNFKVYNLLLIFIVASIVIISSFPTGTLFGLPVKTLAILSTIVTSFYIFYNYRIKLIKINLISFIFFLCIFFVYTLYGTLNFGYMSILELKFILSTFLLSILIYILFTRFFTKANFFYLYSYSTLVVILIKIIAYTYASLHSGRLGGVEFYNLVFGFHIVSMELPSELYRLYLQTDIIPTFYPFVLAWFIKEKLVSYSLVFKLILLGSLFVVLSSFSRYLIAVFVFGLHLSAYINKNLIKLIILECILIFSLIFLFYDEIILLIDARLYSSGNNLSDSIRVEQKHALIELYLRRPYFGFGIGAYDSNLIRSSSLPFSYEKQLLSFLPKFGLFGVTILFTIFLIASYKFILKFDIIAISSMVLFIMSGLFNPYLYSTNVILIYSFIFIIYESKFRKSKKNILYERM